MKLNQILIKNFRSIKEQSICDIGNALLLVGKNNSGKSAILNAVRLFFGQYIIKEDDFHKNERLIEIKSFFKFEDAYLYTLAFDMKIGGDKIPSSASEFDSKKVGTQYEQNTFTEYKRIRQGIFQQSIEEIIDNYPETLDIWLECIKQRYGIVDEQCEIKLTINKENLKKEYYDVNNQEIKDVEKILPLLAFIDDDRNFSEEESGKTKTITNDLFGNYIIRRTNGDIQCHNCSDTGCEHCLEAILQKRVDQLDIEDLEKLLKRKVKSQSLDVSTKVSAFFQRNYNENYRVEFEPHSDINKSISISTKIFDNNIQKMVDLANVGAGVRSIYILSLLQAYHQISNRNNIIFIIEEPEIYLHPSLQKEMSSTLYELSKNTQIILTTHSPLMLKNFELDQVRKVYLNELSETTVTNTNLPEVFKEIGYSTEDVIDVDFVIFLEGKDDKKRLEYIINKYYEIDSNKVLLIDTKSCHNIEIYATLRFLNRTSFGDNFLIIRDSDTCEPSELKRKLINKFRENLGEQLPRDIENKILITTYSSFDNYFLNPHILQSLRIIRDEEDFYNKIGEYLESNKQSIVDYLYEKNPQDRAVILESSLFEDISLDDKIQIIKQLVRGHNLFGIFGGLLNRRIEQYVQQSTEEDFVEILNHLDILSYFRDNKRQLDIPVPTDN